MLLKLQMMAMQAVAALKQGGTGIGEAIGDGVSTAYDEIVAAANPIALVVIAGAGLWLILGFGSQKTNEKVKVILLCVIAGFLIINFAQTFVDWAAGLGAA